jgi:hypothetical protein
MKKLIFSGITFAKFSLFATFLASTMLISCNSDEELVSSPTVNEQIDPQTEAVSLTVNQDEDFSDRVSRSRDTWSFKLNDGDSRNRTSNPADAIARAEAFTSPFTGGTHNFDGRFSLNVAGLSQSITIAQLFATCDNCGAKAGPQMRVEVTPSGEIKVGSRSAGSIGKGLFSSNIRVQITAVLNDGADTGKFTCKINGTTYINNANFDANGASNLRASFRFGLYYNDPMTKNITSSVAVATLN